MKSYLLWTALIVSISISPAPALAARLGIFVRVTEGDRPTGIDQLALLDQIAGRAELALGLTVVRASELLTSDVRRSVIDCGENLNCIAGKLRTAEIELGLLATIDATTDPALILVMLVDAKTAKLAGRTLDENSRDDTATIARLAEENGLRLITAAGHPIGGRALLRVDPSDAAITLRGAQTSAPGRAGEKMQLAPGKYSAEISKPGYVPKTIDLEILAGKDLEVSTTLETESNLLISPWLWLGVGAAVIAGAAVTAVVLTQGKEAPAPIPGDDGRVIQTLNGPE